MTTKKTNTHPGEILDLEFLEPLGISQYGLAKDIGVPETRISDIVLGKRAVTADTALRLGAYFGTSPRFWLNLQNVYDLHQAQEAIGDQLAAMRDKAWEKAKPETEASAEAKAEIVDRLRERLIRATTEEEVRAVLEEIPEGTQVECSVDDEGRIIGYSLPRAGAKPEVEAGASRVRAVPVEESGGRVVFRGKSGHPKPVFHHKKTGKKTARRKAGKKA